MGVLKAGDKVQMKYGGEAEILGEFGSGGQGTVYKASYNGKEYALKWYHKGVFKGKEKEFYANLENNIQQGAPTGSFLWPLGITDVWDDCFGYIMDVRPQGYYELTEYFVPSKNNKQARFKSFQAIANAAVNIIEGFRELHNSGYSYQDINNGNFFIDPANGNVLICDNDNVSPFGVNLGILGKQRYMAPEVVTGKNDPDKQSDRFSLAVILFRLLFINHPLEGRYSTPPCMTKELERKYYGTDPLFVFDPDDDRNRPVPGTDNNLRTFWPVYPDYIKDMFIRAFSKEVMLREKPRVIEKEWLDVFLRFKAGIVKCPACKEETFLTGQGENTCIECGMKFNVPNAIQFANFTLPLYPGVKIMLWHVDSSLNDITSPIGEVVANGKNPKLFGLKNLSNVHWKVTLPDGNSRPLAPEAVVPIKKGFSIECTTNPKDAGLII
ncbi:MAG: serine/threonine protein kinase [Lachnospiraceae bacterium]|nr:serine/threonine protein kinase [Lachnospiraceae bacterium]